MNRYALEMHARERLRGSLPEATRDLPPTTRRPQLELLWTRSTRQHISKVEVPVENAMTFIYEIRAHLVDAELDEVLPMIK
jgi:hypothetical protein